MYIIQGESSVLGGAVLAHCFPVSFLYVIRGNKSIRMVKSKVACTKVHEKNLCKRLPGGFRIPCADLLSTGGRERFVRSYFVGA